MLDRLPNRIRNKIVEAPCPIDGLEGDCWLWQGHTYQGYGSVTYDYRSRKVHVLVFELLIGQRIIGLTLDHLCRVRRCCNPQHLEQVTCKVNILRGVGLAAVNAVKTHCKYGHALTPENTAVFKGPHHGRIEAIERSCRICNRRRYKEWYKRDKRRKDALLACGI